MNILFEIADRDLLIIGAVMVAIAAVLFVIFKAAIRGSKVKPISEDERFDSEDDREFTEENLKAKEELEKVYKQMSADLEKKDERENIEEFEREQEENAIISYQELMAAAERLKKEANDYEDKMEKQIETSVSKTMDDEKPLKEMYRGFKNSDIISPIYGIQKEKKNSSKSSNDGIISRAYEEDALSEKENNVDFLNSLKEFRKNL